MTKHLRPLFLASPPGPWFVRQRCNDETVRSVMTKPCDLSTGKCAHCGDAEQGECEGWNDPEPTAKELRNQAVMQQALDALCLPCSRWNKIQTLIINAAIAALRNEIE